MDANSLWKHVTVVNGIIAAAALAVFIELLPAPFLADLQIGVYAFLPSSILPRVFGALLFLLALQVPVLQRIERWLDTTRWVAHRMALAVVAGAAGFVTFVLLYSRHPIGDTGVFPSLLTKGLLFIRSDPLSTLANYNAYVFLISHPALSTLVSSVYDNLVIEQATIILMANLSGFFFLLFTALLSFELFPKRKQASVFFLLVTLQGYLFLFFGDKDVHTQELAAIMLFLFLSVRCIRGMTHIIFPSAALGIAYLLHNVSGVLLPSLFALYFLTEKLSPSLPLALALPNRLFTWRFAFMCLAFAGVVLAFFAGVYSDRYNYADDFFGGGKGWMFVPLHNIGSPFQHYTMFSYAHFLDVANLLFLLGPLGLVIAVLMTLSEGGRLLSDRIALFFLFGAMFSLAFVLTWNFDYGAILDANLAAVGMLLPTVLGAYLLCRRLEEKHFFAAASAAIAGSALHLIPLVLTLAGKW